MDRVIFRKYIGSHAIKNGSDNIIAFLPDQAANFGCIMSYEHIGQHGEADIGIIGKPYTVLAKPEEYQDLLNELKAIGYKPQIFKRLQYGWLNWQR